MSGWDHPDTVRYYEAFNRRHARYRAANRALVRQARIEPGHRVLDFAAGTGGTTAVAIAQLGPDGRIDCVEPAAAMRAAGEPKFDARVRWFDALADTQGEYDRILCGAAIWQMPDLRACLRDLAERLKPGGALCFNIPAAYLGEPDPPGGGADPYLTALPAALAQLAAGVPGAADAVASLPARSALSGLLREAGLIPRIWAMRTRLGQAAWRDWLKIPVMTDSLLGRLDPDQRARCIDNVFAQIDAESWRPERWFGWTARRPLFDTMPFHPTTRPHDAAGLRERAERDGYLYLPRLLARKDVLALRRRMLAECRALGLADQRGRWLGGRFGDGSNMRMYSDTRWIGLQQRVQVLPEFAALGRSAALGEVLDLLLGPGVEGGQGSVCRLAPPLASQEPTEPHRDYQFITRSRDMWTAWMPLGDCPLELGPVAIAPGSHRDSGIEPPAWATAAMSAGDVLLFNTMTLHRACANFTERSARLSADFRYTPKGEGVPSV